MSLKLEYVVYRTSLACMIMFTELLYTHTDEPRLAASLVY